MGRKKPDLPRAEAAVRELLLAFGLAPEADPELAETPRRVARAYADTLLAGYGKDPIRALGPLYPSDTQGAVAVTGIPFLSMCPHHLLPLSGLAHVAFLPRGKVPGFGRVAALVDALAHRLVLQEDLTQRIADALVRAIDAEAAACVLEARHGCVAVGDLARMETRFRTSAGAGPPERVSRLLAEIDAAR